MSVYPNHIVTKTKVFRIQLTEILYSLLHVARRWTFIEYGDPSGRPKSFAGLTLYGSYRRASKFVHSTSADIFLNFKRFPHSLIRFGSESVANNVRPQMQRVQRSSPKRLPEQVRKRPRVAVKFEEFGTTKKLSTTEKNETLLNH